MLLATTRYTLTGSSQSHVSHYAHQTTLALIWVDAQNPAVSLLEVVAPGLKVPLGCRKQSPKLPASTFKLRKA